MRTKNILLPIFILPTFILPTILLSGCDHTESSSKVKSNEENIGYVSIKLSNPDDELCIYDVDQSVNKNCDQYERDYSTNNRQL